MNIPKAQRNLLLIASIAMIVTVLTALPGQSHNSLGSRSAQRKMDPKSEQNPLPLANYTSSGTGDEENPALRRIRSKRYDNRDLVKEDPQAEAVDRTEHWWAGLSALPVAQSDAVVLGKVTKANAYLSSDKTGVYSEFKIRVERVFKNYDSLRLGPGDSVTLGREGGAVKFPSGHVQRYSLTGQIMPQVGQLYVFFLKHNVQEQDFSILTAYEMNKGRIFPLDRVDVFAPYENAAQNLFLNRLSESIANPQQPILKQGSEQR